MYRHYGSEVSLYSGKTRAYLRYKDIPFEDVDATAQIYRNVIVPNVGRPIIPVLETPDGEILQDTTVIIDRLEERFPEHSVYPETPVQRLVALLFEVYGDEWLVMPAMHYRWHYKRENLWFILNEFGGLLAPRWPKFVRPLIGMMPALAFGRGYVRYFGLTAKMHGPVEKSYQAFLRDFDRHLEQHDFLLGSKPSIGDFGLVAPLYAHLYRDPYSGRDMKKRAPNVARWVERMQRPDLQSGEFLPGDEVPATLEPIVRRIFREQLPVLVDTIRRTAQWAKENPDRTKLPRVIGSHTYELEGVRERRMVTPFSQWMFQRPLLHYQSLDGEAKARADELLGKLGGLAGLNTPVPVKLDYRNHRVVVAPS